MPILPREMVTQRHPNSMIAAPGVVVWMSETDLAACDVDVIDESSPEDAALAVAPEPYMEWDVETYRDTHPDFPGVYRSPEYGQGPYGALSYGAELEYNEGTDPPYSGWVSDDGLGE